MTVQKIQKEYMQFEDLHCWIKVQLFLYGPRQANLVLIAYASSESRGTLQTESQIPGPSECLGMHS